MLDNSEVTWFVASTKLVICRRLALIGNVLFRGREFKRVRATFLVEPDFDLTDSEQYMQRNHGGILCRHLYLTPQDASG